MKSIKTFISGIALAGLPLVALAQQAQQGQGNTTIMGILGRVKLFLDTLIPILIAGALAYFIFGVIKYVIAADGDEKGKAREVIVRGIIGFFVLISIFGLVGVLQSSLGIGVSGELGSNNLPTIGN